MEDTIVVYCKECDALFYATSRATADDVLEIAELAALGHRVAKVDPYEVRVNFASCDCAKGPRSQGE